MPASKIIGHTDAVLGPLASTRVLAPRLLLQISEYRWLLIGLDLVAVNGALLASLSLRSEFGLRWRILTDHPLWFGVISVLWLLLAHAFDAYELRVAGRLLSSIQAVAGAAAVAILIYLFIPHFTPPLPTTYLAAVSLPILVIAALVGSRAVSTFILPTLSFQRRVLIIGTGQTARMVAQALHANSGSIYQVVGFAGEFPEDQEVSIPLDGHEGAVGNDRRTPIRLPVIGHPGAITVAAARYGITTLVLATPNKPDADLLQSLSDCAEQGIEVTSVSGLYEQLTGRVPMERGARTGMLFFLSSAPGPVSFGT